MWRCAADVAAHRHRAEVEEGDDVGDGERLRVDIEIERCVAFARQPGHGSVEPQIAFRLVHEQIGERDFAFVGRAGDDELAGADAFDGELEIDDLHRALDVVVERVDGEIELRRRPAVGEGDRAGHAPSARRRRGTWPSRT